MALPLMDKLQFPKKIDQYVVAVDGSKCSKHAFEWADFLAKAQDKLTTIHSFETEQQVAIVNDRYAKFAKENNKRYSLEILTSSNYDANGRIMHFVNVGQRQSVDLLVTGFYGATVENNKQKQLVIDNKRQKLSSTSDLSLRSARCSSFFVKRHVAIPESQDKLKMVVGIDGSQNSRHAFECAVKLLQPNNTLYVVHIKSDNSNDPNVPVQYHSENVLKNYSNYVNDVQKDLKFKVNIHVESIEGTIKISDGLCEFAEKNQCHILFVGADGMTAHCQQKPILGSVSDECVKDCQCNIIVAQINDYNSTPRGSFYKK